MYKQVLDWQPYYNNMKSDTVLYIDFFVFFMMLDVFSLFREWNIFCGYDYGYSYKKISECKVFMVQCGLQKHVTLGMQRYMLQFNHISVFHNVLLIHEVSVMCLIDELKYHLMLS